MQDVGHLHRNAIPGDQIGVRLQVTGKSRAMAFQFGVGQGHAHVAEGRAISKFLAGTLEHLDHRLVSPLFDVQGYAGRAFVIPEIRLHCSCPLYLSLSEATFLSFQQQTTKSGASRTLAAMAIQANMPTTVIDRVNLRAVAWPDQTPDAGCAIKCNELFPIRQPHAKEPQ
ncbi:hypothetical protein D3C84_638870 [compost metagenome]